MTVGLIDADVVCYRCGFAAEKKHRAVQEDGSIEHTREVQPLPFALQNVNTVMESFQRKFDKIEVYLSGKNNWRKEFATVLPYKGNRSVFARPFHYHTIREHLIHRWGAVLSSDREADDDIGVRATDGENEYCIVSIDKDLKQIPGQHFNWVKNEYTSVNERDGIRFFYEQCLIGDSTDNIGGVFGIGPVTARKLLAGCAKERALWQTVRKCWLDHYPVAYTGGHDTTRALLETAQLLWISRTGRLRWSPPE